MKKLTSLLLALLLTASVILTACSDTPAGSSETGQPEENKPALTLDPLSSLSINTETGSIENVPEDTTVNELLINFTNAKKDITVTDPAGNALASTDTVSADSVVSIGDSSLKVVTSADAAGPLTAPNEDGDIRILFDSVMHRVAASDTEPSDDYTYTVKLAKNEIEDIQIFLTSTAEKTGMSLEISDVTNANGAVLEMERRYGYYYEMPMFLALEGGDFQNYVEGMYTDPLPELVNPFDLAANESKSFVVKIKTTPETEAGLYKSTVNLKDADGNIVKTAEFRVYVWNFTLDEETASDTAFALSWYNINTISDDYPETTEEATERYIKYYDYMLENRMSAYGMPYDITDERADEYMSNPRVTSFIVAGSGNGGQYDRTDDYVVQAYEKLSTNEEWLEKAYIYTVDEPIADGFDMVREQYEWASELLPDVDFRIVVPLAHNQYDGTVKMDAVAKIEPYVNIWCPQSYAFKTYVPSSEFRANPENYPTWMYATYNWLSAFSFRKYGYFEDRYQAFRERGDKMWWYICCAPEYPHPNFFQSYQGCNVRLVLWQQYMFDIDGLLYWSVNNWTGVGRRGTNGGDGLLLYWGELFKQEMGPVPSVRFECVRDGLEDFQYLTQLEGLTDRETSMEYVNRITTEILRFTEDYNVYVETRDELGFYLEEAYAKQG